MSSVIKYVTSEGDRIEPAPLEHELARRFTKMDTLVNDTTICTPYNENRMTVAGGQIPITENLRWVIRRVTYTTTSTRITDIDYATSINNPTIIGIENAIANIDDLLYSRKKSITI